MVAETNVASASIAVTKRNLVNQEDSGKLALNKNVLTPTGTCQMPPQLG